MWKFLQGSRMLGVMETPGCEDWDWLGEGQRDPRGLGQPSPGKNQKWDKVWRVD